MIILESNLINKVVRVLGVTTLNKVTLNNNGKRTIIAKISFMEGSFELLVNYFFSFSLCRYLKRYPLGKMNKAFPKIS